MPGYSIADSVESCVCGDLVVMLNRRTWKYHAIEVTQARCLASVIQGLPSLAEPAGEAEQMTAGELAEQLQSMHELQLVTTRVNRKPSKAAEIIALPSSAFFGVEPVERVEWTLEPQHYLAFTRACLRANLELKLFGVGYAVFWASKRTARKTSMPKERQLFLANQLMQAYYHLRPFAYTSLNRCLFDSLMIHLFLAHFGIYPRWIFAVKTAPWSAHCWLDLHGLVLNDSLERTCDYKPIMRI